MRVDDGFGSRDFLPGDDVSGFDANEGVITYESRDLEVLDFVGGGAGWDITLVGGVSRLVWG